MTGVTPERADSALREAEGNLKCAALMAAGAETLETAQVLLRETSDHLRPAMERLNKQNDTINLGETK